MKSLFRKLILLLFLAGGFPVFAQYDSGTDALYTCWQCPVCGYVVSLTLEQAASIDAYTSCPACYSAYAGNFVPVSCQTALGSGAPDTPETTKSGYNRTQVEDGIANLEEEGSYEIETGSARISSKVPKSSSDTSSSKGKILMVLSPEQYQEEELNVPRDYFRNRGYSVVLASKGVTATGMNGESAQVDLDLKNVKISDYVAVVFVGGEGIYSLKLNEDPDYQALAKSTYSQRKLLAAICLAPWILADAGLLNGKKATASDTDHIKSKGAVVSDESVVRDGNIITGNGPGASQEFAQAIVAALEALPGASGNTGISQDSSSDTTIPGKE
jgi:protease I